MCLLGVTATQLLFCTGQDTGNQNEPSCYHSCCSQASPTGGPRPVAACTRSDLGRHPTVLSQHVPVICRRQLVSWQPLPGLQLLGTQPAATRPLPRAPCPEHSQSTGPSQLLPTAVPHAHVTAQLRRCKANTATAGSWASRLLGRENDKITLLSR